jgi:hypothetical protein
MTELGYQEGKHYVLELIQAANINLDIPSHVKGAMRPRSS